MLEIRQSKKSDYAAIKHIAESKLGTDFATEEQIFNVDISLIAKINNEVAGYGTAGIVKNLPKLNYHLSNTTGMLYSVAVSEKFERQGIASALCKERVRRLWDMKCDSIIATAWETKGVIHVGKILLREGFEIVEKIPKFWEDNDCVKCGDKCFCTAVVFKKKKENAK